MNNLRQAILNELKDGVIVVRSTLVKGLGKTKRAKQAVKRELILMENERVIVADKSSVWLNQDDYYPEGVIREHEMESA